MALTCPLYNTVKPACPSQPAFDAYSAHWQPHNAYQHVCPRLTANLPANMADPVAEAAITRLTHVVRHSNAISQHLLQQLFGVPYYTHT